MKSATAALLAVLLVCSLPAMTVIAAEPVGEGDGDTTRDVSLQQEPVGTSSMTTADSMPNRLDLTGEVRSEHTEYGHDIGTALAASDDELRVDHDQYVFLGSDFDGVDTDEQITLLEGAYEQLTERSNALETRERTVVQAHAAGEQATTELVQVLIRNHNEAAVLSEAFDELSDRAGQVPGYSLSVDDEQSELDLHQSEIRSTLEATVSDRAVVAVQTSETGYTFSTIDSSYVRETTRFDNRDTEQPNQFDDITDAYEAAREVYPWVFETGKSSEMTGQSAVQLYEIRVPHEYGQLEATFDGGTGEVHREAQVLTPDALPTVGNESWSGDGLTLSVTETPMNGPATVTVTDSETDEPESATVTIDDEEVGETDAEDGTLWIVPPAGEYELIVDTGSERLNATVSG